MANHVRLNTTSVAKRGTVIGVKFAELELPPGNKQVLMKACKNAYLLHIVLSLSATHRSYLHPQVLASPQRHNKELALRSTYHYSASVPFNQALSQPTDPANRDALWGAAAFISITATCSDVGACPEEAWPCRDAEGSDLTWLSMSKGKEAIWELTNPVRPGGLFAGMADVYADVATPLPINGIAGIPLALVDLCGLDVTACAKNSPYFAAVHAVAQVRAAKSTAAVKVRALAFIGNMQPAFKDLLHKKNPIALAILALYYTKAWTAAWWLERRAVVECSSICSFLRRWHGGNVAIQNFLRWMAQDAASPT